MSQVEITKNEPSPAKTPKEEDAMAESPSGVVIEMKKPAPATGVKPTLPLHAKLAHLLALVVAAVAALCVSTVLADGKSVVILKDSQDLPIITNISMKKDGFDHRLDELLGPTYGAGLHHDQSGRSWGHMGAGSTLQTLLDNLGVPVVVSALPRVVMTDALKHPVPLLACNGLKMAGLAAMSLGFVAVVVAFAMVVFHALVLGDMMPLPPKHVKALSSLVWLVLVIGTITVLVLAVIIFDATWICDNQVIPSIKISEHFDFNYGFSFAVLGFVGTLLVFLTLVAFTPTEYDGAPNTVKNEGALSVRLKLMVTGLVIGLIVGTASILTALAAVHTFDAPLPVDDSINPCSGRKPKHSDFVGGSAFAGDNYFSNVDCMRDGAIVVLEQAGANVTAGYVGGMDACVVDEGSSCRKPIDVPYDQTDLCPVNVHWHLGAEHLSMGEYDWEGTGPVDGGDLVDQDYEARRKLGGSNERLGFRCHHYNASEEKFTKEYDWKYCTNMLVGETYEVHWPHSAAGACGTKWQYQTPFYDGVFCKHGVIKIAPLNTYETVGVQGQVFTIVNDDDPALYHPNLFKGMLTSKDGEDFGTDMAIYTGSTTGTSRNNVICSRYTPITWQVDRKCHMVSASSFDKMCKDMKAQAADMKKDLYPHGARKLVLHNLTANNQIDGFREN